MTNTTTLGLIVAASCGLGGAAWTGATVCSAAVGQPAIVEFIDHPATAPLDVPQGSMESLSRAGTVDAAAAAMMLGSPCPWDLDADGMVGVTDLLMLLAAWGTDPGRPPDFDGDGMVGILDLLSVLAMWGPCP